METFFSTRRSLDIQRRVIGALLMREIITRYGRHNIGFLWLFVEPMLFTLGITLLWVAFKATHGSSLPIVAFAITGYSSVLLWRNGASRCAKAIESNLSLLYHRNVRVLDIFAARIILELAGATISLISLTALFVSLRLMPPPADLLRICVAWLLLSWFAVALALFVGALSERTEVVDRIWHTITYLIFPVSGAAYMVDWLPQDFQKIVLWLPMVHGVEMLRKGYFGSEVRTYEDPGYFIMFNLVLLLLALCLVRETGRRVEPE